MPQLRSRQSTGYLSPRKSAIFILVGVLAAPTLTIRADEATLAIRSREVELHYRLNDPTPGAEVQLWYTRDRGATWRLDGRDDDRSSPAVFTAPAEGLYGFIILIKDKPAPPEPLSSFQPAHRWIFIDYTPPLV